MRPNLVSGRSIALVCGLALALAAQQASAVFIVNQPWVRPAQRTQTTEAYMNLTSTDGAVLVGAVSAAAAGATIRAPGKVTGQVARLPLPARKLVALSPGGYRIVLRQLAQTLKPGDRVQLTLTIERADGAHQDIAVDADVRLHSPIDDELRAHTHAH